MLFINSIKAAYSAASEQAKLDNAPSYVVKSAIAAQGRSITTGLDAFMKHSDKPVVALKQSAPAAAPVAAAPVATEPVATEPVAPAAAPIAAPTA